MDSKEIKLSRVLVGQPPYADHYVVGATATVSRGCNSIILKADGNGLSGFYDRVHVHFDNGRHLIFPAHNCAEMEVLTSAYKDGDK